MVIGQLSNLTIKQLDNIMVLRLSIKNFLSLKNVKFNMGRKIFLIGANNSGKSSVGKAIEFLYANVIEDNIKTRTIFCIDEDMDLGTYSDIVYNHEENKPVIFRFDYRSSLEEYGVHYDGEINKIMGNMSIRTNEIIIHHSTLQFSSIK